MIFSIYCSPKSIWGGGKEQIISEIEKYYTYGPYKPQVSIENDWVIVKIDVSAIASQDKDYQKTISLCEKGRYNEAKPILKKLIEQNPTNSEYHRIMGQIRSDEGEQNLAIDSLIEALRWDPKNAWALLMMGNIMAKFKKDIPTAIKFYNQTLVVKPDDHITINNIGANLMQQGKIIEAKKFFNKALIINEKYPNTHFAIGMIGEIENDFFTAFSAYLNALRLNKKKDDLYRNSMKQVFHLAQKIIIGNKGKDIIKKYLHSLEFEGDKEIVIKEDTSIATAAKFELAEN
jgi:tetratricopeptide (TPR) repeat protein